MQLSPFLCWLNQPSALFQRETSVSFQTEEEDGREEEDGGETMMVRFPEER